MSKNFGTIITSKGTELIADCILRGEALPITTAAVGDGGGAYYEPIADQTALKNECWRGEITGFSRSESVPNMLDVKVIVDDEAGGFTIREMGLFTADGILVAVCNTPDTEKIAITGGMPGRLTMVMHIIVADSSAVKIVVNPELDSVTPDQLKQALTAHNSDENAHSDIRALAADAVQQADAAIEAHNADPAAHGSLLGNISQLEGEVSRLTGEVETLALRVNTNITANPFSVTFKTLDGLSVSGVHNTSRGTIDF